MDGYCGPIYDHCERHGIVSIGHLDCEGELNMDFKEQLDFLSVTKRMQNERVDTLSSAFSVRSKKQLCWNLVSV